MKFAAFILAIVIIAASIDPVPSIAMLSKETADKCLSMAEGNCMRKTDCAENKGTRNDQSKKDCQNGACNPFAICNCFPAIISSYKEPDAAHYKTGEKKPALFNERIYSSYYSSCWHPPELI